uniref:Uncharacterized protein n=1 Tax=Pseudictyota dubia TaxID=2749911 RepID=A0A7R9VUG4_9STRA|mmetsp:Transcript_23654/g.43713  ORF Transcript_23654/g.43713 Transcript_23654/m.43713 type:complete len:115 (+) Transcript_23654:716-1060(+)
MVVVFVVSPTREATSSSSVVNVAIVVIVVVGVAVAAGFVVLFPGSVALVPGGTTSLHQLIFFPSLSPLHTPHATEADRPRELMIDGASAVIDAPCSRNFKEWNGQKRRYVRVVA